MEFCGFVFLFCGVPPPQFCDVRYMSHDGDVTIRRVLVVVIKYVHSCESCFNGRAFVLHTIMTIHNNIHGCVALCHHYRGCVMYSHACKDILKCYSNTASYICAWD